ncbi:MAG: hypothetical protein GYB15_08535 [Gammaproteobacteria bacterium]|nr:hypothetical protein [Gammaproteobacteria bacterium]
MTRVALSISALSLLLSCVAIGLPFWQSHTQFQAAHRDQIDIQLRPAGQLALKILDQNMGELGHVIQVPIVATIRNSGYQDTSIVGYEIFAHTPTHMMGFSGIDGGIYDESLLPAKLPSELESGSSKKYLFYVGAIIKEGAYQILKEADSQLTLSSALSILANAGTGFYGEPASLIGNDSESFSISLSDSEPIISICVESARSEKSCGFGDIYGRNFNPP